MFTRFMYPLLAKHGAGDSSAAQPSDADIEASLLRYLKNNGYSLQGESKQELLPPLMMIYKEGYEARETSRQLKTELDELREKVPDDNAIVLDEEQAKVWELITGRELVDEAKLSETLERGEKFPKLERQQRLAKIALAAGWKDNVLDTVLGDRTPVLKDPKADPNKLESYVIETESEGKTSQEPVQDWVKSNRADYLPSLTQAGARGFNPTPTGIPPGPTSNANSSTNSDYVKSYVDRRKGKDPDAKTA